jgi:hypothetical protein
MEVIISFIIISIFEVIILVFAMKYGRIMLMKGYKSFAVIFWSVLYFLVGLIIVASISFVTILDKTNAIWAFLSMMIGTGALAYLYSYKAIKLPYKINLKHGRRKVPLGLRIGIFIWRAALILVTTMFIVIICFPGLRKGPPLQWYDYLRILFLLPALPMLSLALKKRALFEKQAEIANYSSDQVKVLYLRSFYLDIFPFAKISTKQKGEFGNLIKLQSYVYEDVVTGKVPLNFEEYFSYEVSQQLGNFVCIGNPTDRIPKEGIAGVYPKWNEWQASLYQFVQQATIILMQIGNSQYIRFELETIIKSGNLHKLCIITEPVFDDINDALSWRSRLRNWTLNARKLNWNEIGKVITEAGLKMDFIPIQGSVIVFPHGGDAVCLISGCTSPSEYVSAIKNYFDGNINQSS